MPDEKPWWMAPLLEIWEEAKAGAAQKQITGLIESKLRIKDLRNAQAIAALIRPHELAAQDGRAARRRSDAKPSA